jgi:uncharacterized protein (DUF1684 family)
MRWKICLETFRPDTRALDWPHGKDQAFAHERSRRWRRIAVVAATSVLGLIACTSGPSAPIDARPYAEQIEADRRQKDDFFRTDGESPLPVPQRASFAGLPYFAVDPGFRVPASLQQEPTNPPVIILMATSRDRPRRMQRVGTLQFTVQGQSRQLSAYVEEGQSLDRLFVPFGDLTNGLETYEAGRNLELPRTATGVYDLDFNRAYHPYCLYNANYDCPIPPKENRLDIPIRAGERLAGRK